MTEPSSVKMNARWVLAVSVLGSSLGFIDSSVVNIALPAIQDNLSAGLASIQWVSNGYMLSLASLILLGGGIGDKIGTLRAFRSGLLLFVLASIACGSATATSALILSRIVQGAGAALLVPTSLALISQVYKGDARGKAIGAWSAAGGALLAIGPPLGGWLVQYVGWRSIFYINVPVAAAALLLSFKASLPARSSLAQTLDYRGAAVAVVTLALLTYGLIELGEGAFAWGSAAVLCSIPVGFAFLMIERHAADPLVPLRLFRDRNFLASNALTVILYGGLGGALFIMPFSLVKLHHYTPTAAGMSFLPLSIILGVGSRFAGGLAAKIGPRIPLVLGPIITAVGFTALGMLGGLPSYWLGYFPGLVLISIGMTLTVPVLTTMVFDSSPDADSGTASGINNAAARTGGLLAVAAVGICFGGSNDSSLSTESLAGAYRDVMLSAALAALLSALCAAAMIRSREPR